MTDELTKLFDDWTRAYALLGLRLDRLAPGTVDAWTGPPAWREQVLAEPKPSAEALRVDARRMLTDLGSMGYERRREAYLRRQVTGLETVASIAAGQPITFGDQVRRCFDIKPERVPDTVFEEAHRRLADVLPGHGPLAERVERWRTGLTVPVDTLPPLLDRITAEVRRRTEEQYHLPEDESVEVRLVANEPWGGYNWYLGEARSRIEVNTDLPVRAHGLVGLLAHEGYPGHHTEHALREMVQFHERGQAEYAIQLINTPECVVSEGIATSAREMIFEGDEDLWWLAGELPAEIVLDPEQVGAVREALETLSGVGGNAAFLLHEDGRSDEDVVEYLQRSELRTPEAARKHLEFLRSPLWRGYVFTYTSGHALLKPLLTGTDRHTTFERILTEPVYPERLRHWDADSTVTT